MFRNTGLMSDAPCPALIVGRPCAAPRCIFSHNVSATPPAPTESSASENAGIPIPAPAEAPQDEEIQAKLLAIVQARRDEVGVPKRGGQNTASKRRKLDEDGNSVVSNGESSSDSEGGGVKLDMSEDPDGAQRTAASAPESPLPHKKPAKVLLSADRNDLLSKKSTSPKHASRDAGKSLAHPGNAKLAKSSVLKQKTPEAVERQASTKVAKAASSAEKKENATSAVRKKTKPLDLKPAKIEKLNPRLVTRAPSSHQTRLDLLTKLHIQLKRLYRDPKDSKTQQEIIEKALDLEVDVAVNKRPIYTNAMSKMIVRYMKMKPEDFAEERNKEKNNRKRDAERSGNRDTMENERPALDTGLEAKDEVEQLSDLIALESQLVAYGHILKPPGPAEIQKARQGVEAADGWETCDRCDSKFRVFRDRLKGEGLPLTTNGSCSYHSGRRFKQSRGSPEFTWNCCNREMGAAGCAKADTHVYNVKSHQRLATILPFVETPENPNLTEDRAIALDCEMCYTTNGMELIRLTVTAFPSHQLVMDALVSPFGQILDLNTRFSGVTDEMFVSAPAFSPQPFPPVDSPKINPTASSEMSSKLCLIESPLKAREHLLSFIGPSTPIIGHALENDLLTLRLCHRNSIDTSILFPHSKGLPMRNRLKYAVERFLQREIQKEGDVAGHDSAVDARCAAELVRWKIVEVNNKDKSENRWSQVQRSRRKV